jgi:hypothetical protein
MKSDIQIYHKYNTGSLPHMYTLTPKARDWVRALEFATSGSDFHEMPSLDVAKHIAMGAIKDGLQVEFNDHKARIITTHESTQNMLVLEA